MAQQADGSIIIDLKLQQDEFDKRLSELEGKTSKFGSKIKTAMKAVAAAGVAAFAALVKGAVDNYAQYEQLVGGVETLFKESSDAIIKYANDAYKTAGLSANDYMETITSFSASLLQGLGGDTKKAAELGNQAVIDMADNANKMGTDIGSIQAAYQGFAKQNYTMLDNLKLGYGGTQSEMIRLINDSGVLGKKIKSLDGVTFDQMIAAIHKVQTDMGISGLTAEEAAEKVRSGAMTEEEAFNAMGTTAKEAATTIEGSYNSMKAAWTNFLTGMADENADFDQLVQNLVDSIVTYVKNIGPRIIQTVPTLAKGLSKLLATFTTLILKEMPNFITNGMTMIAKMSDGFVQGIPDFVGNLLDMIQQFADNLAESAPVIINKGFEMLSNLVQGITNALPVLISKIPQIVTTFANIINDNFPTILVKGAELLWQLITGILSAIPDLIANIPQIIEAIVATIQAFEWLNLGKNIIEFFGNGIKSMIGTIKTRGKEIFNAVIQFLKDLPSKLLSMAKNAISNFGKGITNSTGTVKGAIKGIFNAIVNGITSLPSKMISIGKDLVKGLWNGIGSVKDWILDKIKGFGGSIVDGIASFFGIASPSKLMRDAIGKFLPPGIAVGFELAMPKSIGNMENSVDNMTDDLQKRIDMNMNDISTSANLEGNINVNKEYSIAQAFPKSMNMNGGLEFKVYLDKQEVGHIIAPIVNKELGLE